MECLYFCKKTCDLREKNNCFLGKNEKKHVLNYLEKMKPHVFCLTVRYIFFNKNNSQNPLRMM